MPRAVVSWGLPLPTWPLTEKKREEPVPLSPWGCCSGAAGALREEEAAAATADDGRGGELATDDRVGDLPL